MYDHALNNLRKVIDSELELIEAISGFDYGPEFEIAICNILRRFLPQKYGICRGHAVSKDGEIAGDDIIIFDRSSFPSFHMRTSDDFSRKEKIPVEAIYAYIECKHNLVLGEPKRGSENSSLAKASQQVANFKRLCKTRELIPVTQRDPYIKFTSEIHAQDKLPKEWWLPTYRNPVFGCIFSRRISFESSRNIIDDVEETHKLLLNGHEIQKGPNVVDLVVAGKHNTMAPAYMNAGDTIQKNCLFMLPEKTVVGLSCYRHENSALSMGVLHLIAALDWIRLGRIPWEKVLNHYNQPSN